MVRIVEKSNLDAASMKKGPTHCVGPSVLDQTELY